MTRCNIQMVDTERRGELEEAVTLYGQRQYLRESTPSECAQSHPNRDEEDTQRRIQEIRHQHHANSLRDKSSAIEITTDLCRCQPSLQLSPIRQISCDTQENAHGQVRNGRDESRLLHLKVQRLCNERVRFNHPLQHSSS